MFKPNDYNFWFQKAMKGGRFFEDIQRSLKLNPHHIDSWIYYAGYYASDVNENDKIVEVVNELLKYDPKLDESPSLIEYVLTKVQKYTDDDAPLKKVSPEPPYFDSKYYRRYCGEWLIAASYYWKKNQISDAWNAFVKAFSFSRNNAILWYIHLVLNIMKKKYKESIENGEKAVEIDPEFKHAWQQLGKAYLYRGDFNHAIDCNERALELDEFFEPSLKLKDEIKEKLRDINNLEMLGIFSYQRQRLSKEEVDFLLELERECEKTIPVINEVKWDDTVSNFGFVSKNGHVVELGLNLEAISIIKIPESIRNLKYLEILSITNLYHLQNFPENIIYLERLKYFRYEPCRLPFYNIQENPQGLFPKIICEINSIEKLYLREGYSTPLPEELAFLPKLNEIELSPIQKLSDLPPTLIEYFDFQEFETPKRKILIRKKEFVPKSHELSPDAIYNQFLLKTKSETEVVRDLHNLIEESESLKKRIKAVELLKKIPSKSDIQFNMLEEIFQNESSILLKIAALGVILTKYKEKAYESIRYMIKFAKTMEVIDYIRNFLQKDDSNLSVKLKNEFHDFFIINGLEKLIGQRLTELTDFKVVKKRYHSNQGPHGYIKKGNRITHLGLNLTSPVLQHVSAPIPSAIGKLKHLEELVLTDCQKLKKLPESIGNLGNLRILDCTGCISLKSLPVTIGNLKKLEILNLSGCHSIKSLPSTICKLNKLKILDSENCWALTTLTESLTGLNSLEVINLKNCGFLKHLPETVGNLPNLKVVNLENCGSIENLPNDLFRLKSLENIKLKGFYHLKNLPDSIGNLKTQTILDLSFCYSLAELPESLGDLRDLKRLILRGCRELISIPESIGNLEKLEELNLYACKKLTTLPSSIGQLKNLKKLDLSYCDSLKSIPDSITNLKSLDYISMEGCKSLKLVPETIVYLNKQRELKKKESPYAEYRKTYSSDLDLEIKEYQKKRYSELKSVPIILTEKIQNLIKCGVDAKDAEILIRFFRFLDWDLDKSEIYEDLDKDQGDMWPLHHYKINDNGKVIELHLHHGNSIYLSIFPEYLCLLDSLEVIRFPNNLIEIIPECISNLKLLRTLELNNIEVLNPTIPESIKSFVESLENYNTF